MERQTVPEQYDSRFNYRKAEAESPRPPSNGGDIGFGGSDRRFAFSRQASFQQSSSFSKPLLTRNVSSIDIPDIYTRDSFGKGSEESKISDEKFSASSFLSAIYRGVASGNKPMRRLFALISLNVAYSTVELFIGLFSGRVGLVSDAFHLTFGCGLLTFSLFAIAASRTKPDRTYTYGYKRLEVLSAFTNATAISIVFIILLGCGSTSCIHTR
ncbi:metal tolerance protein C2-like [Ipomoea triloba]|uniref:metal tolerance protein C2-like n=1 Tax=Ipomoea triloba TaxID=35885 RepID=UPI00125DD81C|nr:metal tolerance protein C2-like [Ipomoea triloba]